MIPDDKYYENPELLLEQYKEIEFSMKKNFLQGILDLGKILKVLRVVAKANGKWLDYCTELGTNVSQANAKIRFYEFAENKDIEKVMKLSVCNWKSLNEFLALAEEDRLESLEIGELVKNEEIIEENENVNEEENEIKETDIEEVISSWKDLADNGRVIENVKQASETISNSLNVNENMKHYIQAMLYLENAINLLNTPIFGETENYDLTQITTLLKIHKKKLDEILDRFKTI